MNKLQQKYEEAKANYATALEILELARHTYDNGVSKDFAEAKKNRGSLAAQLDSEKQASENAKAALAQAMRDSNGARSPEVAQALSDRRNTDDMIEQYADLLAQSDQLVNALKVDASPVAREYVNAYENAAQRWAEMNAFAALVECGERLARAMVVTAPCDALMPWHKRRTRGEDHPELSCEQIIMNTLRDLASQCEERRPYVQEIGALELGTMVVDDILSPAQAHFQRTDHAHIREVPAYLRGD
ncbi:hypothetical protein [Burkholderia stagnalis]|uniref:hypothetical protein n=3 Tax=Burkholderia stagnalis TaxID=1503054 RepID=UPI000AAA248E|nr:hypothetical protein [Burkholderia stagnalis]